MDVLCWRLDSEEWTCGTIWHLRNAYDDILAVDISYDDLGQETSNCDFKLVKLSDNHIIQGGTAVIIPRPFQEGNYLHL